MMFTWKHAAALGKLRLSFNRAASSRPLGKTSFCHGSSVAAQAQRGCSPFGVTSQPYTCLHGMARAGRRHLGPVSPYTTGRHNTAATLYAAAQACGRLRFMSDNNDNRDTPEPEPKKPNPEDLTTLFHFDPQSYQSSRVITVVNLVAGFFLVTCGYSQLMNADSYATRSIEEDIRRGVDVEEAQGRRSSKVKFWRFTGLMDILIVTFVFVYLSHRSSKKIFSVQLDRSNDVLYIRTFPMLMSYIRRDWYRMGWYGAVPATQVSLRPSTRNDWHYLLVHGKDGTVQEYDLHRPFLANVDVWYDKVDVGSTPL